MVDAQLWKLLKTIADRTNAGRVSWQPSARPDSYVASFTKYSVEILPRRRDDVLDYVLRLYNSDGDIIEESSDVDFGPVATEPPFELMRLLYERARRAALGADKAIEELLKELGSE